MEDFLWVLVVTGFAGFIIGLYCQYRARSRFNIRRNRFFEVITAVALILMLAAVIILKVFF